MAEDSVALRPKPSLRTWNSWFMSGPGHLCSVAGMQGISKTPPLHVPSTRKQMEQAPGWADEGPPVLPLQGREAECKECQRRENKSILSFSLSIWSASVTLCVLLLFPALFRFPAFLQVTYLIVSGNNNAICNNVGGNIQNLTQIFNRRWGYYIFDIMTSMYCVAKHAKQVALVHHSIKLLC